MDSASAMSYSIRKEQHQPPAISEQEGEESEISAMNIVTTKHQVTKREIDEKTEVINRYKRID